MVFLYVCSFVTAFTWKSVCFIEILCRQRF